MESPAKKMGIREIIATAAQEANASNIYTTPTTYSTTTSAEGRREGKPPPPVACVCLPLLFLVGCIVGLYFLSRHLVSI